MPLTTVNAQLVSGAINTTAAGNVGIGTDSPSYKLDVRSGGPVFFSATNGDGTRFGYTDTLPTNTGNCYVGWIPETVGTGGVNGDLALQPRTSAGANIRFFTGTTSATERMRINSAGKALFNTTTAYGVITTFSTPFDPFSSNWSTSNALTVAGGYGGGIAIVDGSAGWTIRAQDNGKDFYIQGGNTSGAVGGGVFLNDYATSWSSASDENVKDIIEPITNGLEKVSSLRTVIGKYKNEAEGKRHPFLIAQDVQAVLPEAVSVMNRGEANECLGLSYTDTIPLLVAAIKEQQAIITDLKARIEILEAN